MKKNMGGKTKKTRKNLKKVGGAGILNSIFSIIFVMYVIGALVKQQNKEEAITHVTQEIKALENGNMQDIEKFFNDIPKELPQDWETKLRDATDVRKALEKSLRKAHHWTGHSAEISAALPSTGLTKAKNLIRKIAFSLEHKDKSGESITSREFNKERLDYIQEGLDNLSGKPKRSQSAPSGTRRSRSSASKAFAAAEMGALPKEWSVTHAAMGRSKSRG
jgi:hypothetical protein